MHVPPWPDVVPAPVPMYGITPSEVWNPTRSVFPLDLLASPPLPACSPSCTYSHPLHYRPTFIPSHPNHHRRTLFHSSNSDCDAHFAQSRIGVLRLWPLACGCQVKLYWLHLASRSGNARFDVCSPLAPYVHAKLSIYTWSGKLQPRSYSIDIHPDCLRLRNSPFRNRGLHGCVRTRIPSVSAIGEQRSKGIKYCVCTNNSVSEEPSCGLKEQIVSELLVIAGRNHHGWHGWPTVCRSPFKHPFGACQPSPNASC